VKKNIVVKITANFERNLESIEQFLSDAQAVPAFDNLLVELAEKVLPNLERFPDIGKLFMDNPARSVEVNAELKKLQKKLNGGILREYVIADYLMLYVRHDDTIYLLSIKHQRQLSFDFHSMWNRN